MTTIIYDVSDIMHAILEEHRMTHEDLGEVIKFLYIEEMRIYRTRTDYPNLMFYGYLIQNVYEHVPITKEEIEIIDEIYPIFKQKLNWLVSNMVGHYLKYHDNTHIGLDVKEMYLTGHLLCITI